MKQAILEITQQFVVPMKIENARAYQKSQRFIVLGMGGSHLAADLIKSYEPSLDLIIHQNYGLPDLNKQKIKKYLIIANSHSGNTEEVISGLQQAIKEKLNIIVIATGGKLIRLAKKYKLAYIKIPDTGIQPRSALGFSCRAILKAMGKNKTYTALQQLSDKLKPQGLEKRGQILTKLIKNKIPIIYSSNNNISLAYNWKIKFNETGKIPAFYNVLPELNHNEMNGFDATIKTKPLTDKFCFIFLYDEDDNKKIQQRMKILYRLYKKRDLAVLWIKLTKKNKWEKIFSNLILADWTSYYIAKKYNRDPEHVPMVEEFKRLI